jgi:hypothetical protein
VAKSRRASSKRASAASRRAPSSRSTKRSPSRRSKPATIHLKPIRNALERAIEALRRGPKNDVVALTIERLERCLAEFEAICDPESRSGCGPTMTFPAA